MELKQRISDFVLLGRFLQQFESQQKDQQLEQLNSQYFDLFNELIASAKIFNGWFTEDNVRRSVTAIGQQLQAQPLEDWVNSYALPQAPKNKTIGLIMAGNIPLVGFHDFLCVLISGNKAKIKLSSDDNKLLPFVIKILCSINNEWTSRIEIVEGLLKDVDAVIATGSNNSARYFDYYFGKYPHIIRKNRNSVAVLDGTESKEELSKLGDDIFSYFGLGCRSVSKVFVPKGYDLNHIFEAIFPYQWIVNHNKYGNNYDYNKTVYLLNGVDLLENGFVLFKQDESYSSPVAVLFYEYYNTIDELVNRLENEKEQVQCVVSHNATIKNAVAFGDAQCPQLMDYADGIDTMAFLKGL